MFQLHPPKEFVLSYIEQRMQYKRKLDKNRMEDKIFGLIKTKSELILSTQRH
jgi:hypothetical protein